MDHRPSTLAGIIALIAAPLLAGEAPPGRPGTGPVLGVAGSRFTLDGRPAFLLGFSYYGGTGASGETVRRDLEEARERGFDWLRVWATWSSAGEDLSAVASDGGPREPYLGRLRSLVAECGRRGMAVDVTLSRGDRLPGLAAHRRAVETLVGALGLHRNWYLDLANERDVRDARYVSAAELKELRDLARRLDPGLLVTASFGGHDLDDGDLREALLEVGVDLLCPHRPREAGSPLRTEAEVRKLLDRMAAVGRVVPVHLQEPFRRGYGSWEPSADDFLDDLRGAVTGGAAGWCFHNGSARGVPGEEPRRSFDLRSRRLFEALDAEERTLVSRAADLVRARLSGPAYPLRAGPGGRRLVDGRGEPVFLNGDTPWSLAAQVSREDAELYLDHRASLGVNSLIITIPEAFYCTGCRDAAGPRDFQGRRPFLERDRLTTPDPEYFDGADRVIRRAGDRGMGVLMSPLYTGYAGADDGWYPAVAKKNSVDDCRWYGEWIGSRYRSFPNLIYVVGNDRDPGDIREKLEAFARGIRARDPDHLITYHGGPGQSSADAWDPRRHPWLTANAIYLYGDVWKKCLEAGAREPALPFFLFESRYEGEGDAGNILGTPAQVRRQAYSAVLAGACGHHYGNGPVWHMNAAPGYPRWDSPWKGHLDDPGARTLLPNIRKLFESRPWAALEPDRDRSLVVAGGDGPGGPVPAARTADGSTAIIYFPSPRTVTVDLSRIAGAEVRGWWFDPRGGGTREAGRFPAKGRREFAPPGEDDWVLVLDDAGKAYPPPGNK